jgi:hypothetical protein
MRTCTRQISTLVVAAVWLGLAIPAKSPAHGTLTMAVLLDNRVGVTPSRLTAAERVAGNIFRRIGVEIVWYQDTPPQSVLVPHLVSSSTLQNMGLGLDVLGLAVPRTRAVSVMYDRVTELAVRRRIDVSDVLGNVIAHEIGHLYLPGHSIGGILRERLDLELVPQGGLGFNPPQAKSIRARLQQEECGR